MTEDQDENPQNSAPEETKAKAPRPWLRATQDMLLFQLKLFLDWARDLILAPVAVVLLLVGLVTRPRDPGYLFYKLMEWGRWSDRFIGLFSAGRMPGAPGESADEADVTLDQLVSELEVTLQNEMEKSGLSPDEALNTIDQTFEALDDELKHDRSRTSRALKRAAVRVRRRIRDGRG